MRFDVTGLSYSEIIAALPSGLSLKIAKIGRNVIAEVEQICF